MTFKRIRTVAFTLALLAPMASFAGPKDEIVYFNDDELHEIEGAIISNLLVGQDFYNIKLRELNTLTPGLGHITSYNNTELRYIANRVNELHNQRNVYRGYDVFREGLYYVFKAKYNQVIGSRLSTAQKNAHISNINALYTRSVQQFDRSFPRN